MKILKIFGIVVGIHVFALILIFANPGCSSTSKTPPATTDAAAKTDPAPVVTPPSSYSASSPSAPTSSAITFNPNAPAAAAAPVGDGARMAPTRPDSAVANVLVTEPVTDVTPASSYTVKSGDNLSTIAKKNNITIAQLTAANNLTSKSTLHPGQKLKIPAKSGATPAAVPASAPTTGATAKIADATPAANAAKSNPDGIKHVVKSGETLSSIAKKYDVRSGEIAAANNISDPAKIRPGTELIIPHWQPPGSGKSGKSSKSGASTAAKTTPPATTTPPAPAITDPANAAPAQPTTTAPVIPVIPVDGSSAPAPKS